MESADSGGAVEAAIAGLVLCWKAPGGRQVTPGLQGAGARTGTVRCSVHIAEEMKDFSKFIKLKPRNLRTPNSCLLFFFLILVSLHVCHFYIFKSDCHVLRLLCTYV